MLYISRKIISKNFIQQNTNKTIKTYLFPRQLFFQLHITFLINVINYFLVLTCFYLTKFIRQKKTQIFTSM